LVVVLSTIAFGKKSLLESLSIQKQVKVVVDLLRLFFLQVDWDEWHVTSIQSSVLAHLSLLYDAISVASDVPPIITCSEPENGSSKACSNGRFRAITT
jgi:hypothetical protein